jgi:phosphotransferase system IIB component
VKISSGKGSIEKLFHCATRNQHYFNHVTQPLTENKLKSTIAKEVLNTSKLI